MDGEQAANLANFFDYGGILGGISAGILTDKTSEWHTCTLIVYAMQSVTNSALKHQPLVSYSLIIDHTKLFCFSLVSITAMPTSPTWNKPILFRKASHHLCYNADNGNTLPSPLSSSCQRLVKIPLVLILMTFLILIFNYQLYTIFIRNTHLRCPIHAVDGLAVKDSCYAWNIAMTFIIGFFVNGMSII